jgi:hypothetical protein
MTRLDQELLDKQLWGVSCRSPQSGIIILMTIAVFLAPNTWSYQYKNGQKNLPNIFSGPRRSMIGRLRT